MSCNCIYWTEDTKECSMRGMKSTEETRNPKPYDYDGFYYPLLECIVCGYRQEREESDGI